MTGVILTVIEHPDAAPGVLTATACFAGLMGGARIHVLAIRVPPEASILPTEEVMTPQHAQHVRDEEAARVAALRASFDAWVGAARRRRASPPNGPISRA